jgi:thiosulfate/3-mercaptopyruvate sulfurtransferase
VSGDLSPAIVDGRSAFVVSFAWLEQRLGSRKLKIVDASWYLPDQLRDAKVEFSAQRIPGAVHFDIDEIADHTSSLPHLLPSADQFATQIGALGISETDTIIIYDGLGMFCAPRVWWMFRVFGAANSYVLDGGFDQWVAEGRAVETVPFVAPHPAIFRAQFDRSAIADFAMIKQVVSRGPGLENVQIADARGAGRFTGEESEPRGGMRSGHMPSARHVHYASLTEHGRLKPLPALAKIFAEAGLDLAKPVITTCGSGVTAAVITLALQSLNHHDNWLYDGSWAEYGSRSDTDVETGPAR